MVAYTIAYMAGCTVASVPVPSAAAVIASIVADSVASIAYIAWVASIAYIAWVASIAGVASIA